MTVAVHWGRGYYCSIHLYTHSQSELRDRSDSEILSYDQLDSELAQLEEELEGEGEGEGGDVEDVLLDSRTDDDLMLDFAEFL